MEAPRRRFGRNRETCLTERSLSGLGPAATVICAGLPPPPQPPPQQQQQQLQRCEMCGDALALARCGAREGCGCGCGLTILVAEGGAPSWLLGGLSPAKEGDGPGARACCIGVPVGLFGGMGRRRPWLGFLWAGLSEGKGAEGEGEAQQVVGRAGYSRPFFGGRVGSRFGMRSGARRVREDRGARKGRAGCGTGQAAEQGNANRHSYRTEERENACVWGWRFRGRRQRCPVGRGLTRVCVCGACPSGNVRCTASASLRVRARLRVVPLGGSVWERKRGMRAA